MKNSEKESESMTYGAMLKKMDGLISEVSQQDIDLDIMLEKVSEGAQLIKVMRTRLEESKVKIDQLLTDFTADASKS